MTTPHLQQLISFMFVQPRLALQKLLKKHLPRDPNRERSEEQQREDRCRDADERREQQQGDDRQDVSPHHPKLREKPRPLGRGGIAHRAKRGQTPVDLTLMFLREYNRQYENRTANQVAPG